MIERPPGCKGAHSSSLMDNPAEPWKFLMDGFGSTDRMRTELGSKENQKSCE
jgi:hypothetical protein